MSIISKKIFQTYKSDYSNLSETAKKNIKSWTALNPEYEHVYMSDEEAREFIKKTYPREYLKVFDSYPLGAMRADLLRYLYIYEYGGVYSDLDTVCLKPIRSWIIEDKSFIVGAERSYICQWTFASAARHPVLEAVIEKVIENSKTVPYDEPFFVLKTGGPWTWTFEILRHLGVYTEDVAREAKFLNKSPIARASGIFIYGNVKTFDGLFSKHQFASSSPLSSEYEGWANSELGRASMSGKYSKDYYLQSLRQTFLA